MKILLYILSSTLWLNAQFIQEKTVYFPVDGDGTAYLYEGSLFAIVDTVCAASIDSPWVATTIQAYIDSNSHFSSEHINWCECALAVVLSPNYVLDSSGVIVDNWFDRFNGTSDFVTKFMLYKKESIGGSPGFMNRVATDYNGNYELINGALKNDVYGEGYLFIVANHAGLGNLFSIDTKELTNGGYGGEIQGLDYLNWQAGRQPHFFSMNDNNFTGQLPSMDLENIIFPTGTRYAFDNNNFTGSLPNVNDSLSIYNYIFSDNSMTTYDRNYWSGGRRAEFNISNNGITDTTELNEFTQDVYFTFRDSITTGSCLIDMSSNITPGDSTELYFDSIQIIFTDESQALTIIKDP